MEWGESGAHVLVRLRILLLESRGDRLELCIGGLDRCAGRESSDGAQEMRAAEEILAADVGLPPSWNPDVNFLDRERKAAWRDADNLERSTVDLDAAPDDTWVSPELIPPEPVRDDDGMRKAVGRPRLLR